MGIRLEQKVGTSKYAAESQQYNNKFKNMVYEKDIIFSCEEPEKKEDGEESEEKTDEEGEGEDEKSEE